MVVVLGVHAADERQVVHDFGGVREHLGDVHAALAVLLEREGTGEKRVDVVGLMDFDAARERFAREFLEDRFRVEEVHLAGPAVLDELNDGFSFGGKVGWAGLEIIHGGGLQHVGKHDGAETESGAFEELASG